MKTAQSSDQRGFIDFSGLFWGIFIVGIISGAILFAGIPWLWHVLKPFIHRWTA